MITKEGISITCDNDLGRVTLSRDNITLCHFTDFRAYGYPYIYSTMCSKNRELRLSFHIYNVDSVGSLFK